MYIYILLPLFYYCYDYYVLSLLVVWLIFFYTIVDYQLLLFSLLLITTNILIILCFLSYLIIILIIIIIIIIIIITIIIIIIITVFLSYIHFIYSTVSRLVSPLGLWLQWISMAFPCSGGRSVSTPGHQLGTSRRSTPPSALPATSAERAGACGAVNAESVGSSTENPAPLTNVGYLGNPSA